MRPIFMQPVKKAMESDSDYELRVFREYLEWSRRQCRYQDLILMAARISMIISAIVILVAFSKS